KHRLAVAERARGGQPSRHQRRPSYTESMMACRFSASTLRTLRLPSTPLRLLTANTSMVQPGPRYTPDAAAVLQLRQGGDLAVEVGPLVAPVCRRRSGSRCRDALDDDLVQRHPVATGSARFHACQGPAPVNSPRPGNW